MVKIGIVKGRHPMPVQLYAFNKPLKSTELIDPATVHAIAKHNLTPYKKVMLSEKKVGIYITGLTIAILEVIQILMEWGVDIVCYHYNRDTQTYYKQPFKY